MPVPERHRESRASRCAGWLRVLLALALALASAVAVLPQTAEAAVVRPFSSVFATQANGAIAITGNTLERCSASVSGCTTAQVGTTVSGNNNFVMSFVDADADASTTNSSSANVTIPTGARVLFAGLFWGAGTTAGSNGVAATGDKTKLLLRTPGAAAYQSVTAERTDNLTINALDYSSYKNITSIVAAAGSGTYWGANISAATGTDRYAGWSIVVAVEDPSAPLRDLNVFNGYASVTGSETVPASISGFLAPPQGAVNAKFGSVVYEGDAQLSGDYFAVNNTRLADAESPSANFFQSRVTAGGANLTDRNPAYLNNMGIDAKVVDAPGVIPNGATSANLLYATSGDNYYPAALTTQIDLYAPTIRGTKSVRNLSGNDPAKVGDTLEYTLAYSNVGDDNATGAVVTDALPPNTTYVPGSLRVTAGANVGAKTDGPGDDQGEYDGAARAVRFRIGTGANATTGGVLASNATSTMTFRVTTDPGSAGTTLSNAAQLAYTAATINKPYTYTTAAVTTPVAESADVSITKSVTPDPVSAGAPITYTLTAANAGPSTAADVTVTDPLPGGTTLVSSTPSQGTCTPSGQTLTCLLGSVASGSSATVSVVLSVPADSTAGSLTNTATVTTSTSDPNPSNNNAAVSSSVSRSADLALTKSAAPTNPVPGTAVTWTLTARNNGPSTATNVVVQDPVPSSFGSVTASTTAGACTVSSGSVSCTVASVAPGAVVTVTVTGTLDAAYSGGDLTNRADVQSATADPTPGNNVATATVTPAPRSADLSVTKTALTSPVVAGLPISYRVVVTNNGPSDAAAVTLTDVVPAGLTGASANPATGTCSGTTTLSCALGTIPNGASVVVIVNAVVAPDATTPLANTASVSSTTSDPVSTNNSATSSVTVAERADLALTKTASPQPVVDGQNVTYTLVVTNNGPSVARSTVVTDPVPAPLTYVSSTSSQGSCTYATGTVTCAVGTLGVNQSAIVTVVAAVPASGGANGVANTATTSTSATDPVPGNNSATFTLRAGASANLRLAKTTASNTVVAGRSLTYAIRVDNAGPSTAQDVVVTDTLPTGTSFISASSPGSVTCSGTTTIRCVTSSLAVGSSFTISLTVRVAPDATGGLIRNTATVTSSTPDPTLADNSDSAPVTLITSADVGVTKTGPATATAGTEATWTITVVNGGPSVAQAVEVKDALPVGVTFVPTSSGCVSVDSGSGPLLSCPVGALAPGETRSFVVTGRLDSDLPSGTRLTNTASSGSTTPDPNPTNDIATVDTAVTASADLAVTKSVDTTPLVAGAPAVYTLTATNAGPSTGRSVVVSDTLPAGLVITGATAAGASCSVVGQMVSCTESSLPVGASTLIRVAVVVGSGETGSKTNTATVSSATTDPNPANNLSTITTPIAQSADLLVRKTVDTSEAVAGTGLTYTLTVVNNGPSDATAVRLTDTLPAGLALLGVDTPQGLCSRSASVDCTLGAIASGDAVAVTVRASIDTGFTGASLTNSATVSSAVPDPDPSNNTGSVAVPVVASADVSMTKTITPDTVVPGTEVDFSLVVTNVGPSTATGVVVTDSVPAGLTILSATSGALVCTVNGQDITCPIGVLTVGQIVVDVRTTLAPAYAAGTVANTARTTATTPDPAPDNNASTATGTVVRQADLQILKTMSPANPVAGQRVTYTLTATNAGPSDALNPQFIDQLPAGLTDVAITPPPGAVSCDVVPPVDPGTADNPAAPTVTCSGPLFPAGLTVVGSISATVTPSFTGALTNVGRVSSDTIDPVSTNNESAVTGTVTQSADLAVTKSISPATPVPGADVTFTMQVTNAGPSVARDVTLSDPLQSELSGATAVSSVGSCAVGTDNVVACQLGTLAPAASVTVTVTARVAAGFTGTVANVATVGSSTPDPNPGNNSASAAGLAQGQADLSITKTADPTDPVPGTPVTWTLTVSNAGPSVGSGVVVTDSLPTAYQSVTATSAELGCQTTGTLVSCSVPGLAPGATATVSITATLSSAYTGGPLTNTASVVSETRDSNPANNTASAVTTPSAPSADLQVTKELLTTEIVAGQPVQYRVHVTNAGPSDATGVVVTDAVPAGLTGVSGSPTVGACAVTAGVLSCDIGTIANGASVDVVVNALASPDASGTLTNSARATSATPDPTPNNATGAVSDPVAEVADLEIRKDASPRPVLDGSDITYTLTVTNHGPSVARNTVVTDPVPSPLLFRSSTTTAGTCAEAANELTCAVGTIPLGGSVTVTVKARVPASGGAAGVSNTARVTTSATDPDPSNNSATYTLLTGAQANLVLTKAVGAPSVTAGGPVSWVLTARNDGPSDAQGVLVTDDVPTVVTGVTAQSPGATCSVTGQVVSCTAATLPAGQSIVVTVRGTVAPDAPAGALANSADVTERTPSDPTDSDNHATATTQVTRSADLAVVKTGPTTAVAGTQVDYTLSVTNAGLSTAEDAAVSDPLPIGTTFVSATGPGGDCTEAGGLVTCPLGTLAPGGPPSVVTIRAEISSTLPAGTLTNSATVSSSTPDPVSDNNIGPLETAVTTSANLGVTKTVTPTTLVAGGDAVYRITVTNAGPSLATAVVVDDPLPAGLTPTEVAPTLGRCTVSGSDVRCDVGDLVVGGSVTILVKVLVAPDATGEVTNPVTVTSATTDPESDDNGTTVTAPVAAVADLALTKTASLVAAQPGDPVVYVLTVRNLGPSDARDAQVTDTLPSGLRIGQVTSADGTCTTSGQTVSCALAPLAAGSSATVTIGTSVVATSAGDVTNTARVTSSASDPVPGNNSGAATIAVSLAPVPPVVPVHPNPPPGPGVTPLPDTGAHVLGLAGLGLLLVLSGAAAILFGRRRHT